MIFGGVIIYERAKPTKSALVGSIFHFSIVPTDLKHTHIFYLNSPTQLNVHFSYLNAAFQTKSHWVSLPEKHRPLHTMRWLRPLDDTTLAIRYESTCGMQPNQVSNHESIGWRVLHAGPLHGVTCWWGPQETILPWWSQLIKPVYCKLYNYGRTSIHKCIVGI